MSRIPQVRRAGQGGFGRNHSRRILFGVFFVLFVAGGIYFGLIFLRNLGTAVDVLASRLFGTSIGAPQQILGGPNWERQDRVNVLLLGLDRRPDQVGQPVRSDTLMVVSVDPYSQSGALLSIPRDLWVPIPLAKDTVIQDRINAAHFYGDLYNHPGGGPALAMKTVEYNLGVKIHYYAVVDFDAFEKLIDTLGGIDIYLDKPLIDHEYPTPDYGVMSIYIPAGQQHLDGQKALWYARSRHGEGDLGRMKRQQKVLLAVRDKALQLNIVPRLPQLFGQFKDTVKTDLTLTEIMALARVGRDLKSDRITGASIDADYVMESTTEKGAAVLVPKRQAIGELVQQLFFDTRLEQESAIIEVLDGTPQGNLAASAAAFLKSRGFQSVRHGTVTDGKSYPKTLIYDYSGKAYTVDRVVELLGVSGATVERRRDSAALVDIRIILGSDAKLPSSP